MHPTPSTHTRLHNRYIFADPAENELAQEVREEHWASQQLVQERLGVGHALERQRLRLDRGDIRGVCARHSGSLDLCPRRLFVRK